MKCIACEGKPAWPNNPCVVCGVESYSEPNEALKVLMKDYRSNKPEASDAIKAAFRAGQEAMRARAAAEAKNANREGREWANGSLWDAIAREQSRAIAALPLEEMP